MTTAQWISFVLSVVVAFAGSSVISVAITSYINRGKVPVDISKTKADAAAVNSATALSIAAANAEALDRVRLAWHEHRQWDVRQVKRMREAGWVDVEDPPEIWI